MSGLLGGFAKGITSTVQSVVGGRAAADQSALANKVSQVVTFAKPEDKGIEARAAEFETRAQSLGQRAAAAGATRSDNDADLLGFVRPQRKSASRALLG